MRIDDFVLENPINGYLGKYRIIDQNICVCAIKAGANLSTEMMDVHVQEVLDKVEDQRYFSIFDIKNVLWASSDAKNWIKTDFAQRSVNAYAIVAETMVSSLIADAWITIKNLPIPVKKFSNFESAYAWIMELKEAAAVQESLPKVG